MRDGKPIKVALIWSQFAAYHADRCEAVARRLAGSAEVVAIEVATTSSAYAWEASRDLAGARKLTLFPGHSFDDVPWWQQARALYRATRDCDWTFVGLSYAHPAAIGLSWLLRLRGRRVVVFSESKYDDKPRHAVVELVKRLALSCYQAAIVGGTRHIAYMRQLGFQRRPVLPGYDGVSVSRIRREAGVSAAPDGPAFADRQLVFVGRFVDKKNLLTLIDGFAIYVAQHGDNARRLVLVGSGELEADLRNRVAEKGLADRVELTGFLSAAEVSRRLGSGLALVLVSREEQWGLVVNEALALGLPAIVSQQVGARDALVRDGVNGYVVDAENPYQIAAAMARVAASEADWRALSMQSRALAWLGDSERLADAVEALVLPSVTADLAVEMALSAVQNS